MQDHIRKDIRYVVVDEYQDVNPLQERLVRGLCGSAPTCASSATTTRRSTSGAAARWRTSSASQPHAGRETSHPRRQLPIQQGRRRARPVRRRAHPLGERLPKKMVAAGHQQWERGDLLALTFDDPHAEARWIVDRIGHLRGVPFQGPPDEPPRGLSWSDCAVLFRSVAKDSGAARRGAARRDIPFIVRGSTSSSRARRSRPSWGCSDSWCSEITAAQLHVLWEGATSSHPLPIGQSARRCWRPPRLRRVKAARGVTTSSACTSISSRRSASARTRYRETRAAPSSSSTSSGSSARSSRTTSRSTLRPSPRRSTTVRQVARAPGARLLRRR